MSKRFAQHRFVTWLALAAMALIVLMPAISRSMPMDGVMPGMAPAASADCAMHAGHHHASMPGHPDDPTARCGYCVLLSHTPVLAFDLSIAVPPALMAQYTPRTVLPAHAPATPLLSAHPRGPPLVANG